MKKLCAILCSITLTLTACQSNRQTSPDGTLILHHEAEGTSFTLSKSIGNDEVVVMEIPEVGISTTNGRGMGMKLKHIEKGTHETNYTMLTGKRRECSNRGNEYSYVYEDTTGAEVRLVFRLYNDGLAFRYEMDYTPCTFSDSQHPHITTHAHELALTVLYESALQHLADRPESYLAQPSEVKRFLSQLPTVWDDTKLLSGYPGKWVAMARRAGNDWYVGAINGLDTPQRIAMNWDFLAGHGQRVITFGDVDDEPRAWDINPNASLPDSIGLAPRGGFVAVITDSSR